MDSKEIEQLLQKVSNLSNEEIIVLFDPANAQVLPETALLLMPGLSDEVIKSLAHAYPNKPTGNNYLILQDTTPGVKQLHPRSTWANLHALKNMGMKNYVALTFTSRFKNSIQSKPTLVSSPIQDISNNISSLPGLSTAPAQTVQEITGTEQQEQKGEPSQEQAANTTATPTEGQQGQENADNFEDLTAEAQKAAEAAPATTETKIRATGGRSRR